MRLQGVGSAKRGQTSLQIALEAEITSAHIEILNRAVRVAELGWLVT